MHQADITITVLERDKCFYFRVHSEKLGLLEWDAGEREISDFQTQIQRYYLSFENPENFMADPESRGHALFALLPNRLQGLLWDNRGRMMTLLVVSQNTWLPWELMILSGDNDGEGTFLSLEYQLSQWLAGGRAPTHYLPLKKPAWIAGPDLFGANEVRDNIADRLGVAFKGVATSYEEAAAALASGQYDLLQFLGHNRRLQDNADEVYFELTGEKHLAPQSLLGSMRHLGKCRPLVFMAACGSAVGGKTFTESGGWPRRFLNAGAGAFIGTYWGISQADLYIFSDTFYSALADGEPIAAALQEARRACIDPERNDYTGLAFMLFSHPAAYRKDNNETEEEEAGVKQDSRKRAAVNRTVKVAVPLLTRFGSLKPKSRIMFLKILLGTLFLITLWLGTETMQAREHMLKIDPLTYRLEYRLVVGAELIGSSILQSLGALFADNAYIKTGCWLIVAFGSILVLGRRRFPHWLMLVLLLAYQPILASGTVASVIAVRAKNLASQFGEHPVPSRNLADRIAFESYSWLVNDSLRNDRRRENLFGLTVWLLIAGLVVPMVIRRVEKRRILTVILLGYAALSLFVLFKLPAAYAYAKWGFKYPAVVISEHEIPGHDHMDFEKACCLYDISAGATDILLWAKCPGESGNVIPLSSALRPFLTRIPQPAVVIFNDPCGLDAKDP